jgi:phenylacetate-CoA ligase
MRRWFIWNVLFRLHERAKRHDTFRFLREMEAAERLSPAALEDLRRRKLRDLLEYAHLHVPYVKARMAASGVRPSDIREPADLRLFPLMRKADIRANREALRSDIAANLSSFTTGGSTGDPLIFDLAKRRVASRVACRQRTSRWWGVSVGDPELALWGAPVELTRQDTIRGIRDFFLASRLLSAFEMNEATMSGYLDVLQEGGYRQVFGYPSALYLLCAHAQKERRNLRGLGVRVAFVTGEVLFPYQREMIANTLNCPVANGYGGRDSALIAHECPEGGMHILSDAVIVETLDPQGNPVPSGEPGEIVVTDLYSHEAPFIRYATGDVGVLSPRACPCGRPLPLLERIEGRSNDMIVAPDARIINSLALIYAVREVEGVENFRICQTAPDRFEVTLVAGNGYARSGEDRIRRRWMELLRAPLTVTFAYVRVLPPDPSGKFRHVVSQVRGAASAMARQ